MVLFQYGVLRCRLEIRVYIYIHKIFNTMWDVSVILFLFFGLFYGDCEFSEKLLLNFFETSILGCLNSLVILFFN